MIELAISFAVLGLIIVVVEIIQKLRAPHEIAHLSGNTFAHAGLGVKKHAGHGAKVSAALTGKKQTPEHTENHAAALRGRKHTPEHRQKQSDGLRAYHARRRAAGGH